MIQEEQLEEEVDGFAMLPKYIRDVLPAHLEVHKLEDMMNNKTALYTTKIESLIQVWNQVKECQLENNGDYVVQLMDWLKRHTLNIVLNGDWKNKPEITQTYEEKLLFEINNCELYLANADNIYSLRCKKLVEVIKDPWGNEHLRHILNGSNVNMGTEVYEFFRMETGHLVSTRLKQLCESRCEDLALNLLKVFMECHKLSEVENFSLNANLNQIRYCYDVYIALLFKYKKYDDILTTLRSMSLAEGLELIARFAKKRISALKIWKNCVPIVYLVGIEFVREIVEKAPENSVKMLQAFLEIWFSVTDISNEQSLSMFKNNIRRITFIAESANLLYPFCEAVFKKFGNIMKTFVIELYIRALTSDMNTLERERNENETEKATATTERLANGFLLLADVLDEHVKVSRECALTSFSLVPTRISFNKVVALANRSGCESIGSWKCKYHPPINTDGRSEVLICKECGEPMNEVKKIAININTALSEALTAEEIGLAPQLCDDLVVLLSSPRYQFLNWLVPWCDLYRLCVLYLDDADGTRNFVKDLKFVEIDYSLLAPMSLNFDGNEVPIYENYLADYSNWEEPVSETQDVSSNINTEVQLLQPYCPKSNPDVVKLLRQYRRTTKRPQPTQLDNAPPAKMYLPSNCTPSSSKICAEPSLDKTSDFFSPFYYYVNNYHKKAKLDPPKRKCRPTHPSSTSVSHSYNAAKDFGSKQNMNDYSASLSCSTSNISYSSNNRNVVQTANHSFPLDYSSVPQISFNNAPIDYSMSTQGIYHSRELNQQLHPTLISNNKYKHSSKPCSVGVSDVNSSSTALIDNECLNSDLVSAAFSQDNIPSISSLIRSTPPKNCDSCIENPCEHRKISHSAEGEHSRFLEKMSDTQTNSINPGCSKDIITSDMDVNREGTSAGIKDVFFHKKGKFCHELLIDPNVNSNDQKQNFHLGGQNTDSPEDLQLLNVAKLNHTVSVPHTLENETSNVAVNIEEMDERFSVSNAESNSQLNILRDIGSKNNNELDICSYGADFGNTLQTVILKHVGTANSIDINQITSKSMNYSNAITRILNRLCQHCKLQIHSLEGITNFNISSDVGEKLISLVVGCITSNHSTIKYYNSHIIGSNKLNDAVCLKTVNPSKLVTSNKSSEHLNLIQTKYDHCPHYLNCNKLSSSNEDTCVMCTNEMVALKSISGGNLKASTMDDFIELLRKFNDYNLSNLKGISSTNSTASYEIIDSQSSILNPENAFALHFSNISRLALNATDSNTNSTQTSNCENITLQPSFDINNVNVILALDHEDNTSSEFTSSIPSTSELHSFELPLSRELNINGNNTELQPTLSFDKIYNFPSTSESQVFYGLNSNDTVKLLSISDSENISNSPKKKLLGNSDFFRSSRLKKKKFMDFKRKYSLRQASVVLHRLADKTRKRKLMGINNSCISCYGSTKKYEFYVNPNKSENKAQEEVETRKLIVKLQKLPMFNKTSPLQDINPKVFSKSRNDKKNNAKKHSKLMIACVVLNRVECDMNKAFSILPLSNVPGLNDLQMVKPSSVDRIVQVVQVPGGRCATNVPVQANMTQISPHIQRIGQPRLEKLERTNLNSATTNAVVSAAPTLINFVPHQTRPIGTRLHKNIPTINLVSPTKPANTSCTIQLTSTSSSSESQVNSIPRVIASGEQILSQLINPDGTSTQTLRTLVGSAASDQSRIVQLICKASDGKLIPVTSFTSNKVVKLSMTQTVNSQVTGNAIGSEENVTKFSQTTTKIKAEVMENSEILPKFQQAFGKPAYQNCVNECVTVNDIEHNSRAEKSNTTKTIASVNVQPIQGGVIYARQVPVGQSINILPPTCGQILRIATSSTEELSLVKETVIQGKMTALLAAALQGNRQKGLNSSEVTINSEEFSQASTHFALTACPTLVQSTRIVKPIIQMPSNTSRNSPQNNLSSTTLEQLREFDMVYKQVKERSNTGSSTDSSQQEDSATEETQHVSVTYLNQGPKVNCAPVVVVNNCCNIQPASSPTLTVTSQSSLSPCITSAPTSTPTKIPVKSKPRIIKTPITQITKIPIISKPQQKPQEDEHTTQRIFDILAEYAEQLRNSPDLNNKPAPRRRSNPPTNCSQSSKRKKSTGSKKMEQSNSTIELDIEDAHTIGSEDSSCGVVQLCVPDEEVPALEANEISVIPKQIILADNVVNQHHNLIITDSSIGEALKVSGTAVLVPGNYIMPVAMMKGSQQIVVSGGSKILTAVPARSGSNMLLFQSILNQTHRPLVQAVKCPTVQSVADNFPNVSSTSSQTSIDLSPSKNTSITVTHAAASTTLINNSDREVFLNIPDPLENKKCSGSVRKVYHNNFHIKKMESREGKSTDLEKRENNLKKSKVFESTADSTLGVTNSKPIIINSLASTTKSGSQINNLVNSVTTSVATSVITHVKDKVNGLNTIEKNSEIARRILNAGDFIKDTEIHVDGHIKSVLMTTANGFSLPRIVPTTCNKLDESTISLSHLNKDICDDRKVVKVFRFLIDTKSRNVTSLKNYL